MQWTTSTTQLAVLIPLTVASVDIIRRCIQSRIERRGCPLPPGPTPLPFLGSALSVNLEEPFRTYTEWREKYGDIMYIRLLGMDVVVLNSPSAISDLLEKRSQIYSDRPFIATVVPYGHDDINFVFARYGDHFRLCRRIFHQTFSSEAAVTFRPMQLRKARQLILNLIDHQNDYTSHYWTFAASVTMRSLYDYEPTPRNDQMVSIINNFLEISIPALMPERAVLIKLFPFLLHLPDWLPGSSMKHGARKSREWAAKMVEVPYQHVKKRMVIVICLNINHFADELVLFKESKEDVNPSMVSDHVTRMEKLEKSQRSDYEKALKQTSTTAFMGSVETTSALLMSLTIAMVENPHVWKRAQAEIDAVVGTDRLPEFHDRSSLPYVDAIVRETLRWQPPGPLGIPHAARISDVYNGFYIPKGATVFANIWGMTRNESRYANAERFIPERFFNADGMLNDDTVDFVFGFGRRACPGRHTADATLWSAMVTMLATLDFNLAKDADGNDITFKAKFMNGIIRHPLSFPCSITPRSHISKEFLERDLAQ